jgi:hypothetical protein
VCCSCAFRLAHAFDAEINVILPRIQGNMTMKIDTAATAVLSDLILWSLDTILTKARAVAGGPEPQTYVVRVFDSNSHDGENSKHVVVRLSCQNLAAVLAADNENLIVKETKLAVETFVGMKFVDVVGLEQGASQFMAGAVRDYGSAAGKRNAQAFNSAKNLLRGHRGLTAFVGDYSTIRPGSVCCCRLLLIVGLLFMLNCS